MGFLGGLLGGGLASLIGGLAGGFNTRPPSLSGNQQSSLNSLLASLGPTATGTPTIDPIQQSLMFGNIAQNQTGSMDAVTNALVSRGLGRSGLLGGALTQVVNQAQQQRGQANLGLQQQAIQQKQLSIQDILGLLNTSNIPGQNGGQGFLAGMAPIMAYSIQNMMNNSQNNNNTPSSGTAINYSPLLASASNSGAPYYG